MWHLGKPCQPAAGNERATAWQIPAAAPPARLALLGMVLAAWGWFLCESVPVAEAGTGKPPRPNFLVILCDDLGYGDLACYGHPHIRTPNLDRLAAQGMRLTRCYSAAPVCSPSRAGLLCGRTPSRIGIYDWIPPGHVMHLPRSEVTVATLLKRAGYATCHVGKWHLTGRFNTREQPQPGDHGFDYWFSTANNATPSHHNPRNFVRNGKPVGPLEGYSCQLVADEAIRWLQNVRPKDRPFFLFVCFHEPHEPVASPPELVATYPQARNRNEATYWANVTNMDQAVGRLMRTLADLGLEEQTLVFFTSDNGPETLNRYRGAQHSYGSAGPLRGRKLHLYEGGIRVPGILRWPGHVPAGVVSDQVVCGLDVLPTFCQLAGVEVPKDRVLDGTSFVPLLEGKPLERPQPLFWHYHRSIGKPKAALQVGSLVVLGHWSGPQLGPGGGLRPGDMELIKSCRLVAFELYDLQRDLAQRHDLASQRPKLLGKLSAQLVQKYEEVIREGRTWHVPPRKRPGKRRPQKKR